MPKPSVLLTGAGGYIADLLLQREVKRGLAWLKEETSLLVTNFANSVRASVKEYKESGLDNLPAS